MREGWMEGGREGGREGEIERERRRGGREREGGGEREEEERETGRGFVRERGTEMCVRGGDGDRERAREGGGKGRDQLVSRGANGPRDGAEKRVRYRVRGAFPSMQAPIPVRASARARAQMFTNKLTN